MKGFRRIDVQRIKITDNVFRLIGRENLLITAGTLRNYNTMTAAWAALGFLWNKCVAIIYIRPQRYTYGFAERQKRFTLSFFGPRYRRVLDYCGTHSGRDVDKARATGLTAIAAGPASVGFREARLVLVCRKLYRQDLAGDRFLDRALRMKVYPKRDFHRFYIGEIEQCHVRPSPPAVRKARPRVKR